MPPRIDPNNTLQRYWSSWINESDKRQIRRLRVGIATSFTNNYNYGAILQAYALQRFTSLFAPHTKQIAYSGQKKVVHQKVAAGSVLRNPTAEQRDATRGASIRKEAMQRFMDAIPQTPKTYTSINILSALSQFDAFVCGSDVIWSSRGNLTEHPFYWLGFVPSGRKIKIAYAPSLRSKDWNPLELSLIRRYANAFDALSVRESSGRLFLENLLGGDKTVSHVVDPTLLLPSETWTRVSRPADIEGKFVFAYILGENAQQRRRVVEFARAKRLTLVTLPHCVMFRKSDIGFGDIQLYDVDPAQWIWLIRYASYVFTDSFHGAIFSALFHKRFYVFIRNMGGQWSSLGERLHSLMSMWDIERLVLPNAGSAGDIDRILSVDYNRVDQITDHMRRSSADYLLNALSSGRDKLRAPDGITYEGVFRRL